MAKKVSIWFLSALLTFLGGSVTAAEAARIKDIAYFKGGRANQLLGYVGIPPQPWLAGQGSALWTVMFIDIWQWTPMVARILLAGLTAVGALARAGRGGGV
mgnify:CR=1 FL=1